MFTILIDWHTLTLSLLRRLIEQLHETSSNAFQFASYFWQILGVTAINCRLFLDSRYHLMLWNSWCILIIVLNSKSILIQNCRLNKILSHIVLPELQSHWDDSTIFVMVTPISSSLQLNLSKSCLIRTFSFCRNEVYEIIFSVCCLSVLLTKDQNN
jgi:hypothetical protein